MKKLSLLFLGLSTFFVACNGGGETAPAQEETTSSEEVTAGPTGTFTVNTENSNIRWEGGTAGVNVYSHFGNIALQGGNIEVNNGVISSGSFVVDMKTIDPKDEGYSEENTKEDLVGHLSTGDFFLVEQYPTAKFEITKHEGNSLMGNLTIRDKTNAETVEIESINFSEDGSMTAQGKLVFDRQKYDVKWAHFMKDVVLKDEIELDITLSAKK